MSRVDPTGDLVIEIRSNSEIVAGVGGNAKNIDGGEARGNPPNVTVNRLASSPYPFGPGSGRIGLHEVRYAIRCTVPKGPEADIEVMHLADSVAEFLHNRGWRTRILSGGAHHSIANSREDQTGPVIPDPDTGDATVTVLATLRAVAQATT